MKEVRKNRGSPHSKCQFTEKATSFSRATGRRNERGRHADQRGEHNPTFLSCKPPCGSQRHLAGSAGDVGLTPAWVVEVSVHRDEEHVAVQMWATPPGLWNSLQQG